MCVRVVSRVQCTHTHTHLYDAVFNVHEHAHVVLDRAQLQQLLYKSAVAGHVR